MSKQKYSFFYILILLSFFFSPSYVFGQKKDSLPYPIQDRRGNAIISPSRNPFDIPDDSLLVNRKVEYDTLTGNYIVYEKIGDQFYRNPMEISFQDLLKLRAQQDETQYFSDRAKALDLLNYKQSRPKPTIYPSFFNRTFGVTKSGKLVDIRPQGNIDLKVGYQGQYVNNPTLSMSARRTGGFDMNMNANINVLADIGSKMTLPISWNTQSTFDFENQLKLNYHGYDDEIIKSIDAGNINFRTKGTLMGSVQNLFGIKTQLQFGKLFVTAALATDRSQKQSLTLQSGGVSQTINKTLDDYDENRNFLLSQYFRQHFNQFMGKLPANQSLVNITRMEMWVTNRTGTTTNARNIVGLADLGEAQPYNTNVQPLITTNNLPDNSANNLYQQLSNSTTARNGSLATTYLQSLGLLPVQDFEKVYARKLTEGTDYTYNSRIGFVNLNSQLQSDDVLGVAFQYTYNGKTYQVGEFSTDVALDSTSGIQKVLFVKLLKATSQRINLPIWDLMMKNVYSLDVSGIDSSSFNLNVYYKEPGGGTKRYLPTSSESTQGQSLLTILNADRLNSLQSPQPDGQYDYINGYTVLPTQGRIIFPVLEPFGHDLDSLAFAGVSSDVKSTYIYSALYDSIKSIAQTYTNYNRYLLLGTIKGSSSSQISLGAVNIPQGSVVISVGGQILTENTDYAIDYASGTLQILNQSILSSGQQVNVQFENNTTTTLQRNFMGLRLDYVASDKLSIGATMEKLTERPYTNQTYYGEDPINNTMYGVDFNYKSQWPGLTRWLNKLPNYSSTAMSSINAYGEAAILKPGQPSQIGTGTNATVYIDNFESASSSYDLRYPFTAWALASTPTGTTAFPEAELQDSINYGMNRARLSWYNIDAILQDKTNTSNPLRRNLSALSDLRTRAVYNNELFPTQSTATSNTQLTTFDMTYFPTDRGPYNYSNSPSDVNAQGKLLYPEKRWGGIMRAIPQTDFETNNIEYIEFWMQDPFLYQKQSTGGRLVFNLGNVSEDILKDGKHFYENGLNTPTTTSLMDSTSTWGFVPLNPIQLTNAFSNTSSDRPFQDIGFDGLDDAGERNKRSTFLTSLAMNFGSNSNIYNQAYNDPSNDNYVWYRDSKYDDLGANIIGRYKYYNNPQGNSPVSTSTALSSAATMYPDNEDLNADNTLNESEEYFQYNVDLKPGMGVGDSYIVDQRILTPKLANDSTATETWYLFRIPVKSYSNAIGGISDFKSIRFMRMYMTNFKDSTTFRFGSLNLVRNQWRNFTYDLDTTGSYNPLPTASTTSLTISSVGLEANSGKIPIPYKMPPGVAQMQSLANNGVNVLSNEQSMALDVTNLKRGDARAVIKGMNMDMRRYGRMAMFIHAESVSGQRQVNNGELTAVIRIGQDYLNNYYEVKIPLSITLPSVTASAQEIWPTSNELELSLQALVQAKLHRDNAGHNTNSIYRELQSDGTTISVMGSPNLAEVSGYLIGVQNDSSSQPLSAELWFDELRLSEIDNSGGWAAMGRVDIQMADLGTLSVSGNTYTAGFGTIDQSTNERSLNDMRQFDAAMTLDLGKLFPQKLGFTIPTYASITRTVYTPKYDPFDQDVLYKTKLAMARTKAERDSIKNLALDQSTTKTLNFTNVRFARPSGKTPQLWDLSNFDFSYSYTSIRQSNPTIAKNAITRQHGGFGYTFNGKEHYVEPFKKLFAKKSPWLGLFRDFNFNPVPSLLSFRVNVDRQMGLFAPRSISIGDTANTLIPSDTTYDKYFLIDRYYNLRWNFTRNLNFDFSAINNSIVDEPEGLINTKAKRDSVWKNFLKGGRTLSYQQKTILNYNLPLDKLPMTDWINAQYNFTTNYNWVSANLLALGLGNVIENGRQNGLQADFDFTRLYNKSKFFRKANEPRNNMSNGNNNPGQNNNQNNGPQLTMKPLNDTAHMQLPPRDSIIKGLHGKEKRLALKKWRALRRAIRKAQRAERANMQISDMNGLARAGGQLISMVKRVSVQYTSAYNSRVPGIMASPDNFGNNWKAGSPGLGYVFGKQPTSTWLNKMAAKGALSTDSLFNDVFTQSYTQSINVTAQIQPIPSLNIDLNIQKSFSKQYNELFKDTTGNGNFSHLSPYASGGFTISYISFKTMFSKNSNSKTSQLFDNFSTFRTTISKRLGARNAYSTGAANGYANGYGQYAQDVLIPAFLAAYTGKDPNTIPLVDESYSGIKQNPLGGYFPLPNWNLTYSGLSNVPALRNIFSSVVLTHAYNSTLSMNSFTSSLDYLDPLHLGVPGFINSTSGNFVPFYIIPNLTIAENFAPLIGVNVTTKEQNNVRFQYAKSRTLSLSLTDYQVSEVNSTTYTIGGTFRKRNANLTFLPGNKKANGGNDLNITLDLAFRNDRQYNSILDQSSSYSTGGQKIISISPSIDYILSNRVNVKLYFDQQRIIPYISTTYPTTTTSAGIQIRVSLAQ